jgi:hypothetical protein
MNDRIEMIVAGIGGASAINSAIKKNKENKMSWHQFLICLFKAFWRGALVTWGILGFVVHWLSWISENTQAQVFLAIVIGQISLLILDTLELSFAKIAVSFIENIPKFFTFFFQYYFKSKKK